MTYFLSIQNTYDSVEIALFQDNQLLATTQEDKLRASKYFVHILQSILKENNVGFNDLQFLAVNQGPGPFTTLRVVIASVNGLSFSNQIQLIGIDGLDALLLEFPDASIAITVAMLNAFNNDVYFAVQSKNTIEQKGCENILIFLEKLKKQYPNDQIRFIGNGTQLFFDQINTYFETKAILPSPLPQHCSVKQIGLMGFDFWQKKENLSIKLMPLYLKQTITPAAVEIS